MRSIASRTQIGERPHRMTWQREGPTLPDGDGGFSASWINLNPPATFVSLEPATAASLERVAVATAISANTYIARGPHHPQITTRCRGLFNGRTFNVTGVSNTGERGAESVVVCVEIVE